MREAQQPLSSSRYAMSSSESDSVGCGDEILERNASNKHQNQTVTPTAAATYLHRPRSVCTSQTSSSSSSSQWQHLKNQNICRLCIKSCMCVCVTECVNVHLTPTFVSFFVHVLGLDQPVHVADHVLLHLFALLRLLQLATCHRLLSFLGKLSAHINTHV